jgi:hypothetical protein
VTNTDVLEVAVIQSRDLDNTQALGQRKNGRVRDAERKVGVLPHELGRTAVVLGRGIHDNEVAIGQRVQEEGSCSGEPYFWIMNAASATTTEGTSSSRFASRRPVKSSTHS